MRHSVSNHNEHIRAQTVRYLSGTAPKPNLNLSLLTKMLSNAIGDETNTSNSKQKRKATHETRITRSKKRAKLFNPPANSTSYNHNIDGDNSDESSEQDLKEIYPAVQIFHNREESGSEEVTILRHVLKINYTEHGNPPGANTLTQSTLSKVMEQEGRFREVLVPLRESLSSPKKIDLGKIILGCYNGRGVGVSAQDGNWLLSIPSLTIDDDTNDLQNSSAQDLLIAALTLQQNGQAHLNASIKMVVHPHDEGSPEFGLEVEIVVSLVLPSIVESNIPKGTTRRSILALEDARRRVLRAAYTQEDIVSTEVKHPITVSSFYNILGAAPSLPSDAADRFFQPEGLLSTLLPFQKRSVAWLLDREGMTITPEGTLVPRQSSKTYSFWRKITEGNHIWHLNLLSGQLLDEAPELPNIHGGMLAEEPGLGKTVETIALILMNPATADWNPTQSRWDADSRIDVKAVKATLIVTPPALASQWRDELTAHAPSLKVLIYDGWTKIKVPISERTAEAHAKANPDQKSKEKGKKRKGNASADADKAIDVVDNEPPIHDADGKPLDWARYIHQFDVVITTYSVLRSEIHVARPGPDRYRREYANYSSTERVRSPLVIVEWKRVVMDEVQMVGGGSAAQMVSLIPRLSSLAVSGTPAKAQMADLIHVLKFLRIDQLVGDLRQWKRLLKPGFSDEFTSFLQYYGIRTTKSNVANELTIPEQTRYLVGIELGRIERHVYDQVLERVLLDLGLDVRGVAATSNWQADGAMLRNALRKLRGICTHPQVGQLHKRGDGTYKPNALRTMDAVLEAMRDQNWKNLMEDWKAKILLLIRHAQLLQKDDTDPEHHQSSLKVLESAAKETNKYLEEINDTLSKHDEKGNEMKKEAARLRQERSDKDTSKVDKGKGKESDVNQEDDDEEDEAEGDLEDKGLPKTPAGEEHRIKRTALKQRLRETLLLLHRVRFLMGDAYHILRDSANEDESYGEAEKLRRQLLKSAEDEAIKSITLIKNDSHIKSLDESNLITNKPIVSAGGIRSALLMEELNEIIDDVLNGQSGLLWKWRNHVLELLTKPLNPGESEADGQEYQRTLDDQGEVETYFQCYVALLADRREALVNERTLLAAHDVREKRLRHTKAAIKAAAAAAAAEDVLTQPEGLDMQPEHEVLHEELSAQRKDLLLKLNGRAIKSILVQLHGIYLKITSEKDPEKQLVKMAMADIKSFIAEQTALHEKLEADLTLLRKSFNQRITYFRHLQEISDSVADVEWDEESAMAAIQACVIEKAKLEAKINTTRARYRYLDNLSANKGASDSPEEETECVLCRCEFTRGYMTHCGHVFCETCMKLWLHRKDGKTCPVCRVAIDVNTIQRFVIDAVEKTIEAPAKLVDGEPVPQSHRKITYNRIDTAVFEDIQTMETYGDFGSKVQTLVRHLAHIKVTDPGAKSIVFSAWADSLHIVEWALRENGIRSLRIDQGWKQGSGIHKFRTDPDILVLLLHGERENAGLNVTCASRVFLLESVVHHSFEIQAIARIDRLGQTRPTEVYCYYAEDTVERNILDLAARKGLSLYTKENSKGTVSISPFNQENEEEIDDPEKRKMLQKGDFIYKVDDMLAILFPHMFEDVEYLLPPGAVAFHAADNSSADVIMGELLNNYPTNAVAGPSRLS